MQFRQFASDDERDLASVQLIRDRLIVGEPATFTQAAMDRLSTVLRLAGETLNRRGE